MVYDVCMTVVICFFHSILFLFLILVLSNKIVSREHPYPEYLHIIACFVVLHFISF